MMEHLIVKKTPAVTIVAAWIRAETGVGPSIASGNQVWSPNCADLPTTPKKRKKLTKSASLIGKEIKSTVSFNKWGDRAKMDKKSTVPKNRKIRNIPKASPQSPTRLTTIALRADLFAWSLVNQKFINKYEDSPTPSQPKNIWIKLPAVSKIAIKKVKKDR